MIDKNKRYILVCVKNARGYIMDTSKLVDRIEDVNARKTLDKVIVAIQELSIAVETLTNEVSNLEPKQKPKEYTR